MEVVTEAVDDASSTRSIRTDQLSDDYSSDDEGTVSIKANTMGGSQPIDVPLSLDQSLGHVGGVLRKDGNFRNTTLNFVFAQSGISTEVFTEFTTAQQVAAAAGRVKKQQVFTCCLQVYAMRDLRADLCINAGNTSFGCEETAIAYGEFKGKPRTRLLCNACLEYFVERRVCSTYTLLPGIVRPQPAPVPAPVLAENVRALPRVQAEGTVDDA